MATYILEGAVQVQLTPGALTLTMSLEGPATDALLEAVVDGKRVDSILRPRPGLMIIPRIDAVLGGLRFGHKRQPSATIRACRKQLRGLISAR